MYVAKRVTQSINVMCSAIWYHLCNLKNVKNTHGGVLLLVSNFTKSNTNPWVFFTFFLNGTKIAQRITYSFLLKMSFFKVSNL